MKKFTTLTAVLILSLPHFGQELQHETLTVNIEIPVRIFEDGKFVEDLSLNDFEVFEDGKPQRLEAVYLVKKNPIEWKQEKKKFTPETSRSFYLFFQVMDYTHRIGEAMSDFIRYVPLPGDNLTVVTPIKTYRLKNETLGPLSKLKAFQQLSTILRKDVVLGNSEYWRVVRSLTSLVKAMQGESGGWDDLIDGSDFEDMSFEVMLGTYQILLERMEALRTIDQKKLLSFADILKNEKGQKHVFLFYQREFLPEIEPRVLVQLMQNYQPRPDIISKLSELFDFYHRDISIDVHKVKQAYSDSSIAIHFLFFTKPAPQAQGLRFKEHSEDIFTAFREMAEATGGIEFSSGNPIRLFDQAVKASRNYYLLYYSPTDYVRDGKFRTIKVQIKNRNYKIFHTQSRVYGQLIKKIQLIDIFQIIEYKAKKA